MGNYDIISEKPVTVSEVKARIDTIKEDLNFREEKLQDYFRNVKTISLKEIEKAKKELLELNIGRLDEKDIVKILNIFPESGTELRTLVSGTGTILVDDNVTKILDVLSKYR